MEEVKHSPLCFHCRPPPTDPQVTAGHKNYQLSDVLLLDARHPISRQKELSSAPFGPFHFPPVSILGLLSRKASSWFQRLERAPAAAFFFFFLWIEHVSLKTLIFFSLSFLLLWLTFCLATFSGSQGAASAMGGPLFISPLIFTSNSSSPSSLSSHPPGRGPSLHFSPSTYTPDSNLDEFWEFPPLEEPSLLDIHWADPSGTQHHMESSP